MSQENVEIVRRMYEAFNRGDADLALELLHPHPELHQPPIVVDAEAYVGREGFVRGMVLWMEEWVEPRLEPQEVHEVGEGVLMRVRVSGKGKTSGIATETEFFHAWTMLDGKPHRCFVRSTRDEALKAAGLAE